LLNAPNCQAVRSFGGCHRLLFYDSFSSPFNINFLSRSKVLKMLTEVSKKFSSFCLSPDGYGVAQPFI
jgi:hypothetical protein